MQGRARTLLALPVLLLVACREGSTSTGFVPIAASTFGTHGCNGPNQTIVSPELVYTDAAIGATSQMAALAPPSSGANVDKVYVTLMDASILELDFTADPRAPMATVVVPSGLLDTFVAAVLGTAAPAEISGVGILAPNNLVVVEHTTNTILLVNLVAPVSMASFAVYVGLPDATPSFVDGIAGASRFSFPAGVPAGIAPSGDLRLFIADRGNHAIREVQLGATNVVRTIAGTGIPFHADGSLASTGFDQPAGVAVSCAGELVVTEVGAEGQRVRSVQIGQSSFFGGTSGVSMTLAGDGMPVTAEGVGTAASTASPVSPVLTSAGELYWVDAGTGVLRRMDVATGVVDCPNPDFADCAAAAGGGGGFSGPGGYAAAITASGNLYVLDGTAGTVSLVNDAP